MATEPREAWSSRLGVILAVAGSAVGLGNFLLSSEWQPHLGRFGIYPMIVASLWVTLGAMLIGGPPQASSSAAEMYM